jgi:hypothetical protein
VIFVVNEGALAQVFHRGLQFSSAVIIPPMLHIRFLLVDTSVRSRKGESLGPSKTIGVVETAERSVQRIFTSRILYRVK